MGIAKLWGLILLLTLSQIGLSQINNSQTVLNPYELYFVGYDNETSSDGGFQIVIKNADDLVSQSNFGIIDAQFDAQNKLFKPNSLGYLGLDAMYFVYHGNGIQARSIIEIKKSSGSIAILVNGQDKTSDFEIEFPNSLNDPIRPFFDLDQSSLFLFQGDWFELTDNSRKLLGTVLDGLTIGYSLSEIESSGTPNELGVTTSANFPSGGSSYGIINNIGKGRVKEDDPSLDQCCLETDNVRRGVYEVEGVNGTIMEDVEDWFILLRRYGVPGLGDGIDLGSGSDSNNTSDDACCDEVEVSNDDCIINVDKFPDCDFDINYELINGNGQIIETGVTNANQGLSFDVSNLGSGEYTLILKCGKKATCEYQEILSVECEPDSDPVCESVLSVVPDENNCSIIAEVSNCASPIFSWNVNGVTVSETSSQLSLDPSDVPHDVVVSVSNCPACETLQVSYQLSCIIECHNDPCEVSLSKNADCSLISFTNAADENCHEEIITSSGYNPLFEFNDGSGNGYASIPENDFWAPLLNGDYRIRYTKQGCTDILSNIISIDCQPCIFCGEGEGLQLNNDCPMELVFGDQCFQNLVNNGYEICYKINNVCSTQYTDYDDLDDFLNSVQHEFTYQIELQLNGCIVKSNRVIADCNNCPDDPVITIGRNLSNCTIHFTGNSESVHYQILNDGNYTVQYEIDPFGSDPPIYVTLAEFLNGNMEGTYRIYYVFSDADCNYFAFSSNTIYLPNSCDPDCYDISDINNCLPILESTSDCRILFEGSTYSCHNAILNEGYSASYYFNSIDYGGSFIAQELSSNGLYEIVYAKNGCDDIIVSIQIDCITAPECDCHPSILYSNTQCYLYNDTANDLCLNYNHYWAYSSANTNPNSPPSISTFASINGSANVDYITPYTTSTSVNPCTENGWYALIYTSQTVCHSNGMPVEHVEMVYVDCVDDCDPVSQLTLSSDFTNGNNVTLTSGSSNNFVSCYNMLHFSDLYNSNLAIGTEIQITSTSSYVTNLFGQTSFTLTVAQGNNIDANNAIHFYDGAPTQVTIFATICDQTCDENTLVFNVNLNCNCNPPSGNLILQSTFDGNTYIYPPGSTIPLSNFGNCSNQSHISLFYEPSAYGNEWNTNFSANNGLTIPSSGTQLQIPVNPQQDYVLTYTDCNGGTTQWLIENDCTDNCACDPPGNLYVNGCQLTWDGCPNGSVVRLNYIEEGTGQAGTISNPQQPYTAISDGTYWLEYTFSDPSCNASVTGSQVTVDDDCENQCPISVTDPWGDSSAFNCADNSLRVNWNYSGTNPNLEYTLRGHPWKVCDDEWTFASLPSVVNNIPITTNPIVIENLDLSFHSMYAINILDLNTGCTVTHCYEVDCSNTQIVSDQEVALASLNSTTSLEKRNREPENHLNIHPNPSRDIFNIEIFAGDEAEATLVLREITGKTVVKEKLTLREGENQHQLDAKRLSPGIYFMEINTPHHAFEVKKLVVIQ